MPTIDEWRERKIGPRSAFQASEAAVIHSDLLLSPAPSRVLVPSDDWNLTSGERRAKRRKILDTAEDVCTGRRPPLLSVFASGSSLSRTVSRILKERGDEWPKHERQPRQSKVWEDVDDHMTILRRGTNLRQVEESPMIIDKSVLHAQSSPSARQSVKHPVPSSPQRPAPALSDEVNKRHGKNDPNSTTASSPRLNAQKKSKGLATIRQRVLTKSFKGSKSRAADDTPAEKVCTMVTVDDPPSTVANVRLDPEDSPFIYHKKKSLPAETSLTRATLVSKHLNKVLPTSPASGKTSSTLRKSLLKELREEGAEITTTGEDGPPTRGSVSRAQAHGTQALLRTAQTALLSTPSKQSLAAQSINGDEEPDTSLVEQRPAKLPAETQALLGEWTPWSGKEPDDVHTAKRDMAPARTSTSESRLSRMQSRSSMEQLLDLEWSHTSLHEQEMDMTDVAGIEIIKSSFPAAQDISSHALDTQSQLGRDIAEVARGVLA